MEPSVAVMLECCFLNYATRRNAAGISTIWHNMYAKEKQLPAKNKSRQLTTVRAQMRVKVFNHQPLCFLKTSHKCIRTSDAKSNLGPLLM